MRKEETCPVVITRREALKKIGKHGIYVPATMAVLTAAPRAFAQSADTATLEGQIVGCDLEDPIVGARVDVFSDPTRSGTTNSTGGITIHNVPAGNWKVTVSASGYTPYATMIEFLPAQVRLLGICLNRELAPTPTPSTRL